MQLKDGGVMGSFWEKMVSVFGKKPDSGMCESDRRVRLNMLQNRFSLEVKKQDKFLHDYLVQAVEAKRTGDTMALGSIKSSMAFTMTMRRRAQRMLHAVRLFATKSDQIAGYKDFCMVLSDVSGAMGSSFSSVDLEKVNRDIQRGIRNVDAADQLMEQMLGTLDASFGEMASVEESAADMKSSAIDDIVDNLVAEKDTTTENHIEELLSKL